MYLYRSNRLERLAEVLAELCREPPASPFSRECVVVQSKGMAAWLSMRLADHFGVWANPDFPRPRQFVQRLLVATLGERAELIADWNRDRLSLAILEALPPLLDRPEFAPIARYFAVGSDDFKWLQLAGRIAQVFDQYAVFRPEMVLDWEEGGGGSLDGEDCWQPLLWRALANRLVSPATLYREAYRDLQAGRLREPSVLPERLFLFGITTLPPIYLSLLAELANQLPVHLLLFTPAEDYWGETASAAAVGHLLRRDGGALAPDDLHLAEGHPLLASLGALGRDFQVLLEERLAGVMADYPLFVAHPGPQCLLHRLQNDILHLRHRRHQAQEAENAPWPLGATDDSLVIHSCHSPLREVEVLQDQLLAMIARDGLAPREIAVMVPDIETYAPLIEAVFGREASDPRFLPYRIADRTLGREAPLIEAFFTLLTLLAGRLTAPQLLDFLAAIPVRERFAIRAEELLAIERWTVEAGIRWGIDEEDRARHGQPPVRQNTWGFGLDRLLLGYALPTGEEACWHGVLPYDPVEGQDAELLGRFFTYCETIFAWARRSETPMTVAAWQGVVAELLAAVFRNGAEEGWQLRTILAAASALAEDGARVGCAATLTLPAYARLLKGRLEGEERDHGFLQGGITFCAMLPMRTIPFAVICLLGLSDGVFPRLQHAVSFDLVARNPLRGDRSRRNDDRYLFLEALLAARCRVYLSYVGRSSRDNAELAPSVVVDELLDSLAESCVLAGEEPAERAAERRARLVRRLVVPHPLQPFSPSYFDGREPQLVSYAPDYHAAARAACLPAAVPAPFAANLPPAPSPAAATTLAELRHFFRNPARFFCRERLDLLLHENEEKVPDREPLTLNALERHEFGGLLLGLPDEGALPELASRLQAKGVLPPGSGGEALLHGIWRQIAPLRAARHRQVGAAAPAIRAIDLDLGTDLSLTGELDHSYPWGLLRARPGRLTAAFLLSCWLDHLAACAMAPGQAIATVLIGRGEREEVAMGNYRPVAEAASLLGGLVALRRKGEGRPLPFFPATAHLYASELAGGKGEDGARRAAWNLFRRPAFGSTAPPEGDDPYVRKVFGREPLSDRAVAAEFATLAAEVFGPLLAHLEKPA